MKTEAGAILDSNDLLWQLNTTRPASPPGVVVCAPSISRMCFCGSASMPGGLRRVVVGRLGYPALVQGSC